MDVEFLSDNDINKKGFSLNLYSLLCCKYRIHRYRSGMVNSKSLVSKVLLRVKWKFELTVLFKHEMLGK